MVHRFSKRPATLNERNCGRQISTPLLPTHHPLTLTVTRSDDENSDTNMSSNKSNSDDNDIDSNSSRVNRDSNEENMTNANANANANANTNAIANDADANQNKTDGTNDKVSVVGVGDVPLNQGGGGDKDEVVRVDKSGVEAGVIGAPAYVPNSEHKGLF